MKTTSIEKIAHFSHSPKNEKQNVPKIRVYIEFIPNCNIIAFLEQQSIKESNGSY